MPEIALVAQFLEKVYQIPIQLIEALPPILDWRGVFRVQDTRGGIWLLRILHGPQAASSLGQTANVLNFLAAQRYPAPRTRLTKRQLPIGRLRGWASLLLSYLEGDVLDVDSPDFEGLGQTLGQLHSIPQQVNLPSSRFHLNLLQGIVVPHLAHARQIPTVFQPLLSDLQKSLAAFMTMQAEAQLVHGDCWYRNAIKTPSGQVTLIDWDCAGSGSPVIDLGYLLLTSHYDLRCPLQVNPDPKKIRAILRGYQQAHVVSQETLDGLINAMQTTLAFQLSEYLTAYPNPQADDLFLQKLKVRFEATNEIAEIAHAFEV